MAPFNKTPRMGFPKEKHKLNDDTDISVDRKGALSQSPMGTRAGTCPLFLGGLMFKERPTAAKSLFRIPSFSLSSRHAWVGSRRGRESTRLKVPKLPIADRHLFNGLTMIV